MVKTQFGSNHRQRATVKKVIKMKLNRDREMSSEEESVQSDWTEENG